MPDDGRHRRQESIYMLKYKQATDREWKKELRDNIKRNDVRLGAFRIVDCVYVLVEASVQHRIQTQTSAWINKSQSISQFTHTVSQGQIHRSIKRG